MRIGLFGGTFDPVHIGHVCAARAFISEARLDLLHVVPAYINPFKSAVFATASQRIEMLKMAFAGDEKVIVDGFEANSTSPSYTYLTVRHLQSAGDEVCILIGDDNLEQFATWREFDTVLKYCPIYVSSRDRADISSRIASFNEKYGTNAVAMDFEATVVSATELRAELNKELLPDGVYNYIVENRLYSLPDRDEVIEKLSGKISEFRMTHSYGVEKMALTMVERHAPELDRQLVSVTALLHDCTKEFSPEEQLEILHLCHGVDEDYLMAHPQLLHAVTGAVVAKRDFGLCDAGCEAIRWHTTGKKGMNMLEKIIFTADFIEDNRRFASCKAVRAAYEKAYADHDPLALDKAIIWSIEKTVETLNSRGEDIDPYSLETLEWERNINGKHK